LSYTRNVRDAVEIPRDRTRRPWCHAAWGAVQPALSASVTIATVQVVVRKPVLGDVDELARINIDTWRAAYTGIVPQERIASMDLEAYRRRWVETVSSSRPGVAVYVGEVDGALAAYAIGGPYRPQEGADPEDVTGLAELYALYVDPPRQSLGAGTAVHDALVGQLAREGYLDVALWVLAANASAQTWYARRGWRPDGARSIWVAAGSELPELRMRRKLRPSSRPPA
jgi:GNAT superfamily N-acetyltransferase